MTRRFWQGHRTVAIALTAFAVAAFLAPSAFHVVATSRLFGAAATPSATPTCSPVPSPTDSPTPTPTLSPTPTPNTGPTPLPAGMAYSDLDGVATTTALAHRLPLAVMIDDQVIARPQSGMSSASIVYQAPADGNQDRYMVVFQEGTAKDIGPVRSGRPYFVYWAAEYKALFGHFGGDRQTLLWIVPGMAGNIYNMDALRGGGCPYHRITTRPGPHNAYTNTAKLIGCAASKKYPATYQNTAATRPFRDDTAAGLLPASQSVTIKYPTGTIGYTFDPKSDSYLRSIEGKTQIDPANGKQVYARSIVVMYQALTAVASVEGGKHAFRPVVHNVGSGKAIIFQEGKRIEATWKKKANTSLTRYYDSKGKEIALVRGEIFIQSIPTTYKVVSW